MTTFGTNLTEGGNLVAGSDFSTTGQFLAVKASTSTDRQVVLASTGGEAISGILQNTPKSGEAAEVTYIGYTKAQAGAGGWTRGDQLMTEAATGKLVTKTSTNVVVGVARESVSANSIGLVSIIPTGG